ncbi:MAG: histidine kinase [Bacteroidota bacterium]
MKWVFPRLLLVLLISALLSQVVIHLMMFFVIKWQEYRPIDVTAFFIYTGNVFIIFFLWSVLYFSYHYWQNNRRKEVENWQLKAQLNEAELTILKSQINPHFLFNALNNIRSLILSEPEKARDMITHISELMRYFIQFNSKEQVTIDQEISVVKDYLSLEKIQFDDRLTYRINVDDAVKSIKIPPMTVQLLVENAIKHGISQLQDGGNIDINIAKVQDSVSIEVINSGQLGSTDTDSGIGLKNLTDRISILFGTDADIDLRNYSNDAVIASINIPFEN